MRAVVHTRYGPPDVLRLEQVERPAPRDDELRVTVHATTVNRTDCGLRNAEPVIVRPFSGLLRPRRRILGTELAGLVEAIGSAVTEFQVGDRVFGVNANRFGAHAEYVCVAQGAPIATMPSNMSFVQAAAVCHGAILALTAVCNTTSLDTIRSLGTGAVIDHTREDFTGNGETYDRL